jgi:phosphatidylglycerophosphate synthase
VVPFATYIGLWSLGIVSLPPVKQGGAGRRLLSPLFIGYYYWLLSPLFRLAWHSGLKPNHITLASLLVSGLSGAAIATGHFVLAAGLLMFGGTLDIVDGHLARARNLASKAGAFLDSTIDRIADGMVFGGCAIYFAGTSTAIAALVAMTMSFTTSYARARGEALGVLGSEGLMQRAERLAILSVALALSPFFGHRSEGFVPHPSYAVTAAALWLLAVLTTFTATSRIVWIMHKLSASEPARPASVPLREAPIRPLRQSATAAALPLPASDVASASARSIRG